MGIWRSWFTWVGVAALAGVWLLGAGCTPKQYAAQADRAAYGLVGEKQQLAAGQQRPFDINYRPIRPAGDDAAAAGAGDAESLLDGEPIPVGQGQPRVLSLEQCLRLAGRSSRSFQTEKEDLYVEALALANLRHDWSLVGGELTSRGDYGSGPGRTSNWDGSGEASLSFTQRFAAGGALALAMGLDFTSNFVGIEGTTFGSLLEANFTQPLLRGAFRGFAYEDLYRAERDLALAILTYGRFVETFVVGIAADYYGVLQLRDRLTNEQENLRRLEQTYKFVQAQVAGGMLSRVQADQAEQNVLNARTRVETAGQDYQDDLDRFKLTLGLPIAARIELSQAELLRLRPLAIPMAEADAVGTALRTRPDVLTNYADLRDAGRDVKIAADAFNPQLDLVLGVSVPGTEPRKPFKSRFGDRSYTAGWDFSYSLDQTDNRDSYRQALIDHNKAGRDLEEFLDTVRLEVRQSYRALVQLQRTHDIQTAAVALAKRRTQLAQLEQKEGLASTRDVLEAEDALRNSKNALTTALVNYVTTRLRFLATLGMIEVDEQGRFNERAKPEYLDRYRGDAPSGK